ncbi:hypothetical protein [Actinokineospora cianjurensis]|uniref:hypothetical protein n=1 Tax=Actinokineospora cianjurensis TaxID=585224 RepID=UPI0011C42D26|nr:hypothetical protein [Actinokineospora cianjurensis]
MSRLLVVTGVLLGAACVSVFVAVPPVPRYLVLAVAIAIGFGVLRSERITATAGAEVARGVGTSLVLLGAYLLGPLLVSSARSEQFDPGATRLSPVVVVALTFLPVLAFLLNFAAQGMRAAVVGVGIVVPTAIVTAMVATEASRLAVVLTMLGLALLAVGVVVRSGPGSPWSTVGITAGALAATAAVGTGLMPLGLITGSGFGRGATRHLPPGVLIVTLVAGLGLAALFGVIAILRRDAAGGLVVGCAIAVPPLALLIRPPSGGVQLALALIPAAVVVLAVLGILLGPALAAASRLAGWLRPGGGTTPGALAAVAGTAAVSFTTHALPVLGWSYWVQGSVTLVVCAGAAVLAIRLPGVPGAVLAGVVLVGLALTKPVSQLFLLNERSGVSSLSLAAGVGLVVAAGAAWALVRAHQRPGVVAAATYLLVGQVAFALWWAHMPAGFGPGVPITGATPVLVLLAPLVLAGVIGLGLGQRGALAHGQAVLAVTLGVAGFSMLATLGGTFGRSESRDALRGLAPLTPTDTWGASGMIGDESPWALWGAVVVLLLVVVAALTTVHRPNAAVTAGVVLAGVFAVQVALVTASKIGGTALADVVMGFAIAGTALGAATVVAIRSPPRRQP